MSVEDQHRWDQRYAETDRQQEAAIPDGFAAFEALLPTAGRAIDVACGLGEGSVWLAERGLDVLGVDASPVAIEQCERLARAAGVDHRCHFGVHDLDLGLPDGPLVDLVVCHRFNASDLDGAMVERLVAGGVLALTVLSEVGAEPGPFRAAPGELLERFADCEVLGHLESGGQATIIVRAAGPQPHGRLD